MKPTAAATPTTTTTAATTSNGSDEHHQQQLNAAISQIKLLQDENRLVKQELSVVKANKSSESNNLEMINKNLIAEIVLCFSCFLLGLIVFHIHY